MRRDILAIIIIIILLNFNFIDAQQKPSAADNYRSRVEVRDYNSKKTISEKSNPKNTLFFVAEDKSQKDAPKTQDLYFEKSSKNYFRIEKSNNTLWNGKHWNLADFPLRVYIKNDIGSNFKSFYNDLIYYAENVWRKADDRISFVPTKNEESADIIIWFERSLNDKYDEEYLGLTNYKVVKDKRIRNTVVEISLLKANDQRMTNGELKFALIHELGHALGLGHSSNSEDIMFPFIDSDVSSTLNYNELSVGDKAAIKSVINLGDRYYTIK